jgi:predicted nucleic acid-binding protein
MKYVLDACALIALFNGEEGADVVARLLEEAGRADTGLFMSIIQLLEVYYDRIYVVGAEAAKERAEAIVAGPVSIVDPITYPVMYEAGRLKTKYPISLADAIACATAGSLQATLVTSDHKELEQVEQGENLSFIWLPAKPHKKK